MVASMYFINDVTINESSSKVLSDLIFFHHISCRRNCSAVGFMVHRTQGFYFNVRGLLITNDPSVLSKLRKLVESWYSYEWSRKLTFPIWLVERTR